MTKHAPIAVAGIQARMGSTRLPGKSLADLAGKPLIHRVWDRARLAARVGEVCVLTSVEPEDDPLAAYCDEAGIPVRRGPLDDVMERYAALLREFRTRYLVRVTGDCPFVSPEYIDLQLEGLERFDGDTTLPRGGASCAPLAGQGALSARALWSALESDDPRDREHVGAFWFAKHRAKLRTVEVAVDELFMEPELRLSVDEPADLELARAIFEHFAPGYDSRVPLAEVIRWLREHPEVRALNERVAESGDNRSARHEEAHSEFNVVGIFP